MTEDPTTRREGPRTHAELAEEVPVGLILLDADLTVLWANRAAGQLMMVDPTAVTGHSALEFVHPEDVELATLAIAVAANYPNYLEPATYRLLRGDGSEATFDITGNFREAADGSVRIYLVISPVAYRVGFERTYAVLAAGAPFEEVMDVLLTSMTESLPGTAVAAVTERTADARQSWGARLAEPLWRFVDDIDSDLAAATGLDRGESVTIADLTVLPEATRAAAVAEGLRAVAVERVPDPGASRPAFLIGWTADPLLADRCRIRTHRTFANVFTLILERHAHLRDLERAARQDGLTGLPNRLAFVEELGRRRGDGTGRGAADAAPCALLFVDLDDFKAVNDRHGHAFGDRFLHAVSQRIAGALRDRDVVARIGGDEFAVLCPDTDDPATAYGIARRIIESLDTPVSIDGISVRAGASVGIALDARGGRSGAELLDAADAAMYAAKRAGKGRAVLADAG